MDKNIKEYYIIIIYQIRKYNNIFYKVNKYYINFRK